jgi:hypothetical protein
MKIIHLKALVAMLVPAGAAFTAAWAVFERADEWPSGPKAVALAVSVLMAGASGLGSFISTSFAQHKAESAESALTTTSSAPTLPPP